MEIPCINKVILSYLILSKPRSKRGYNSQWSNSTEESKVSYKPLYELGSVLPSSEKDSSLRLLGITCGKGPAGPGFKETSLDRITRFAARAKRKMRVANNNNNFECDAMTLAFADFLGCKKMDSILGVDTTLVAINVVRS